MIKIEGSTQPVSSTYAIHSLFIDGRYTGIAVSLCYESREFFASIIKPTQLDAYGVGRSQGEAVDDLVEALRESYTILQSEGNSLSPAFRLELLTLRYALDGVLPVEFYPSPETTAIAGTTEGNNSAGYFSSSQGGRAASN